MHALVFMPSTTKVGRVVCVQFPQSWVLGFIGINVPVTYSEHRVQVPVPVLLRVSSCPQEQVLFSTSAVVQVAGLFIVHSLLYLWVLPPALLSQATVIVNKPIKAKRMNCFQVFIQNPLF